MDDAVDREMSESSESSLHENAESPATAFSGETEHKEEANGDEAEHSAEDDDAEDNNDNGAPAECSQLQLGAPSKFFYQLEYRDHEKTELHAQHEGSRGRRKYSATCKRCGKQVSGTDSFWGFRQHCQLRHGEHFLKPEGAEDDATYSRAPFKREEEELAREAVFVPKTEPVSGLSSDRPSKEFFERLYYDHWVVRGSRRQDGRRISRYAASCNKCSHVAAGVDSFYVFKDHYKSKHADCLEIPNEADNAAKTIGDSDVGSGENGAKAATLAIEPISLDKPAKTFFETFYEDHVVSREEGARQEGLRTSTKYAASCRLCQKRVCGTDSFYGFRQHIKNKHKDVRTMASEVSGESQPENREKMLGISNGRKRQREKPDAVENGEDSSLAPSKHYYHEMYRDHQSLEILPEIPGGRKSHKVAATCKACGKFVSAIDSYHNFRQHYIKNHAHLNDMELSEVPKGRTVSNHRASTNVAKMAIWSRMTGRSGDQDSLNEHVALCAAETLINLSQLTKSCFDRLVKTMDPYVAWPAEDAVRRKHVPALRDHLVNRIDDMLKEAPAVSVMVYFWPHEGVLAVIARCIDTAWQIQNPVLCVTKLRGPQSADALCQIVISTIDKHEISGKVAFIDAVAVVGLDDKDRSGTKIKPGDHGQTVATHLRDSLRDQFKNDANEGMVDNVPDCLKKALENSITSDSAVSTFVKKLTNHSLLTAKTVTKSIPGAVLTWETVWDKVSTAATVNWDAAPKARRLSSDDQTKTAELLKILQYFHQVFQKLEKAPAAVCDVIPILYGLRHSLTKCQEESSLWCAFIQCIFDEIDHYFPGTDEVLPYVTATFLEPSYKLLWCKASNNANKSEDVKDKIYQQMIPIEPEETVEEPIETKEPAEKRMALLSFLGDVASTPSRPRLVTGVEELEAYLDAEMTHQNPLEYWRSNKNRFRRLALLARTVLFLPVVEIPPVTLSKAVLGMVAKDGEELGESALFCHLNLGFAGDYGAKKKRDVDSVE